MLTVLRNDELRRRLGERARAAAERLYSWDVIGHELNETYLRLAAPGSPSLVSAGAAGTPGRYGHR